MPAATEFFKDGRYVLAGEGKTLDAGGMVRFYEDLCARYPIVSIEDGMAEDDVEGWAALTRALGGKIQLVGDDNLRHQPGAHPPTASSKGIANAILIKVNQIGTLTETLEAVEMAQRAGLSLRHVAPLGRDRGRDHRRSRGRHQLRADQDRLAVALRPAREIQPAPAHRGAAGAGGALSRPRRARALTRRAKMAMVGGR